MCGIVAYIGNKPVQPLLIEGLKRLEYRGYDSAGVASIDAGKLQIAKAVGRVANLENELESIGGVSGTIGIAHTRWATHGGVSQINAHPHRDRDHGIALIHNGIIENYASLRTLLEAKGHEFKTETDTEVLGMLISHLYDPENGVDLEKAVQAALREVRGAYAIAVICEHEPDVMVCARKGSPLLVGIGNGEYIVASDPAAIIAHASQAITLDDYSVARLTRDGFRTSTVDDIEISPKVMQLEMDLEEIELGDFEHYMLKEIYEQPDAIRRCLKGRLDKNEGKVVLGGLMSYAKELVKSRRIILTAQGTALHSAMIGEYLLEDLAKIPAECEYASEFRYRNPLIEDGAVVEGIEDVEVDTNFGNHSIQGDQPRTAVGVIDDNHLVFVVVDGRQSGYSEGVTLTELADIFVDLGAKTAYNLDGGGSSTMFFDGEVVNSPSNGGERATSDILYIAG